MATRRAFVSALTGLAAGSAVAGGASIAAVPTLFELRNYSTRPGRRDALVDLFEKHFLDAYQAAGARGVGTFTNLRDPDRWVWIRAFADNRARGEALDGFYNSPEWLARRPAANDTIADISDALLLRLRFGDLAALRAPDGDAGQPASVVECLRWFPREGQAARLADRVLADLVPLLARLGAIAAAVLESVALPNSYPRLPLREDAAVVVLTRYADAMSYQAALASRDRPAAWRRAIDVIDRLAVRPLEAWPLQPTARSALR